MNAARVITAIDQANAAKQFKNAGKLDPERESVLLESFAIELARKPGKRGQAIPLTFASFSEDDGLVIVAGTQHGTAVIRSN